MNRAFVLGLTLESAATDLQRLAVEATSSNPNATSLKQIGYSELRDVLNVVRSVEEELSEALFGEAEE